MQYLHVDRKGKLVIGHRDARGRFSRRPRRALAWLHAYAGIVALAMVHAWAVVA